VDIGKSYISFILTALYSFLKNFKTQETVLL